VSILRLVPAGVSAVIRSCAKLTSLQLQQCVGPFHATDMLHSSSVQQQISSAGQLAQQQHHWQLSTLQLDGPPTQATDQQLLQLLAVPSQSNLVNSGQTWSTLVNLCLVRVRGLSDALLYALAAARCSLQHLKLQDCYTCNSSSSSSVQAQPDPCSGSTAAGVVLRPSFSEGALLQLLQHCCQSSLKSLQLRHAVSPLSITFVAQAVAAAPLLQLLVLDACDLPRNGAFELEASPHGALQAVHVSCLQDSTPAACAAVPLVSSHTGGGGEGGAISVDRPV
jgi:hypothetical protein